MPAPPSLGRPVAAVALAALLLLVVTGLATRRGPPRLRLRLSTSAPSDAPSPDPPPPDRDTEADNGTQADDLFWPPPPLLRAPVPSDHPVRAAYARLAAVYLRPFLTPAAARPAPSNCSFRALTTGRRRAATTRRCGTTPSGRRIARSAYLLPYLHHRPSACPACVLVQAVHGRLFVHDARAQRTHAPHFRASRLRDALTLVRDAVRRGVVTDTELVLSLSDAPPVPSAHPHPFRLARGRGAAVPVFAPTRCAFAAALPFPHFLSDAQRRAAAPASHYYANGSARAGEGRPRSWDEFADALLALKAPPWRVRKPVAVFRGAVRVSAAHLPAERFHAECERYGRPALLAAARASRGRLDVALRGACGSAVYNASTASLAAQAARFRYVVQAEGNAFWADRMAVLPFLPVAVLRQTAPCGMFFEPLLRPLRHFVPVDFRFRNAADAVDWLRNNDDVARNISARARRFAANYLSQAAVQTYADELLKAYTAALETPRVEIMPGAVEVPL